MIVSTKGRYALRMLVDLAENGQGRTVRLDEISERQGISEKYLETIAALLTKAGVIRGRRGNGGGYVLAIAPGECTVGKVLKITEGTLAPVACLGGEKNECPRAAKCPTVAMWQKLDDIIDDFVESVTIADLVKNAEKKPRLMTI